MLKDLPDAGTMLTASAQVALVGAGHGALAPQLMLRQACVQIAVNPVAAHRATSLTAADLFDTNHQTRSSYEDA